MSITGSTKSFRPRSPDRSWPEGLAGCAQQGAYLWGGADVRLPVMEASVEDRVVMEVAPAVVPAGELRHWGDRTIKGS
jgi:hypothetical protein